MNKYEFQADRILLLKHFFEQHLVDTSLDYDELSIKTDGFVVQDIEDFYEKTLFEAYKGNDNVSSLELQLLQSWAV